VALPRELEATFLAAFDPPGKLLAALESLGPIAGRDVLVVDAIDGPIVDGLRASGARIRSVEATDAPKLTADDASADVVLGLWSAFRGVNAAEIAEADRVLRPEGRLLAVHDYGRDDVSRLHDERSEYGAWSHRSGPFLTGGFRVRVVHCFWEFPTQEAATAFLAAAFGERGSAVASSLRRPRLSYNVAVYHRTRP
jgi:hypothetical protein